MQGESFESALGASYRLLELIGQGATGQVWRAIDRRTEEVVAAKLLRQEHVADRDLVARFVQERSVLTGLRHPNLVAVRDLVVEGDRLAIVMDYVDEGSVRDLLRDHGAIAPAIAVGLVAQVLDGLAVAHQNRLVHRDIKPDNVLLTRGWARMGEGGVKLTDFGIARIVGEGEKTTTGLLGTPEYMSPELLTTGAADLPGDIYGVGILLYELLGGRTPFAGPGTDYTIAHRHVSSRPPELPLPASLWETLQSLLDKDPRQRPVAQDAAPALRALVPGLVDLPALKTQQPPAEFASARGPVTMLRGLTPTDDDATESGAEPGEEPLGLDDLDLGAPGHMTLVRPMARPKAVSTSQQAAVSIDDEDQPVAWWRNRRVLASIAGTVILVAGVAFVVTRGSAESTGPTAATAVTASQQDPPLPTGLTVSRTARYDPEAGTVELTLTYAAQNAPLRGPFLQVVPGLESTCPTLSWTDSDQAANLPSVSGIDTECSWSVDVGEIDRQSKATVVAEVSLPLGNESPQTQLQEWLDVGAARTLEAVTDPELSSTSYPVQRLQSIEVAAPLRTVSGKSLPISLLPIWPNGVDRLNPLYRSPSVGEPSSLLTAVAGGESGVRFSDTCSGAVAVSSDGLVVTTLTPSDECQIGARVGNFIDLTSTTFSIASRGG